MKRKQPDNKTHQLPLPGTINRYHMKKIFTILSLILLISVRGYSQQRDTTKHKESEHHRMTRFIRQRLNVDSVKAAQIAAIQDSYKAGMKQVINNGSLNETQKHRAIDSLVIKKNNSLSAILTLEQQEKIIPSTERQKKGLQGNQKP
ncbi:hypothetical protein BDD43_4746 [Mucilaginibacter gracilis]|uniref:LTXXQ motif family protein n=1 Tax=Mucilaginibacter gracilis TaxID=423350 RepID=A0A495J6K1_9SPHI|nr:hypothetical protein [Mucilaginibacter gracilis]RKR84507.1 hypothetical protein BDD43_4746 [Mucilaginibacter gracilis]